MSQKIAVAIIHGVGKQDRYFADGMSREITDRFVNHIRKKNNKIQNPSEELVIEPIYWAPVLQNSEDELWKRLNRGGDMDLLTLRQFLIDFGADAIAYQPTKKDSHIYEEIHKIFAQKLKKLAEGAGDTAPLCIIAHSLGSVIASNYFYDLQQPGTRKIPSIVKKEIANTLLEMGKTFTSFYTFGSPIAIWSLRYKDFGKPISVPSTNLRKHYSNLTGEWINFYDKQDILGYPLKTLNDAYRKAVTEDIEVNVGGIFTSWNPASHMEYWTDNDITKPIARSLANVWISVNQ